VKLDTLGEFGLIDLIQVPCYTPDNVIIGRGDDCAVLPYDERYYQVSSCDLLVEDVHFIRKLITPQELGYKAVAVNLSDVAAMGGKPLHILLSLALPPDYTVEEWQGFYQGVDAICRKYGVNVIGGDTTSSPDRLTINVTVLGLVEQKYLHLRSHAKPGDVIFTTGSLGGSKAGLELFWRKEDSICLTETQKNSCEPVTAVRSHAVKKLLY
jgi:thiamine-monophosphate kinase